MAQTEITSIGIGNMGAALASTLLKASTSVTIWNRTASRPEVQSLITAGAHFTPSITSAIATSPTLLLCLLDYPTIYSVLAPLSPTTTTSPLPLTGKTVINLTNGTPSQARALQSHLAALGCTAYFDGGIMVTPQLVGTPTSFVILSGETEAAYRAHAKDILAPIGTIQYVAEDAGAASLYDVAALAAMYGMFAGAFTGMALLKNQRLGREREEGGEGKGGKVEIKGAVDGVVVPVLAALVPYVGLLAEQVDRETWGDSMGNPLAMQAAGVRNILRACEEEGVDGTALGFLAGLMDRAVEEGGGEGGVAVVAKYLLK
jgi:3-hydroxyisobutyrate dehydrogenase-like beta-hydroxyacid dehydrogenase